MINFEEYSARVRDDFELRKLLQLARTWGVPPSRFLGLQEPALITLYIRDDAGRVVRTEARREPEWDEEARALALALDLWESGLCDGCGYPLEETTKPENSEAYVPQAPVRCHRCTAQIQAMEAAERPQEQALRWPVEFDQSRVLDLDKWDMGNIETDKIIDHEANLPAD